MPPELNFEGIYLEDEKGNTFEINSKNDNILDGLVEAINQQLEQDAIEEQKQIKKEKRKQKFKTILTTVVLVETIINLWVICKATYFGIKEMKKGNK